MAAEKSVGFPCNRGSSRLFHPICIDNTSGSLKVIDTRPQTEAASAESIEADDQLLKQFSAAIIDITTLEAQVMSLWNEELCMMLPESTEEPEGADVHANAEGESSSKDYN